MCINMLRRYLVSILLALMLAGCSSATPEPMATAIPIPPAATPVPPPATPVPLTVTPIPPTATPVPPTATPVPPTATSAPPEVTQASGDIQPLSAAACSDLADAVTQTLGVAVTTEETPFQDHATGQTGTGCQATTTGSGLDFENVDDVFDALTEMLQARGWTEDLSYAGGGPGSLIAGYRQAEGLCLVVASSGPSEDNPCTQDEPFVACWERLTPEQQVYTATLNCAQATALSAQAPEILSIDSFSAQAVDNGDGGRIVTFDWQTTGAAGVRIFNGATFVRFGT